MALQAPLQPEDEQDPRKRQAELDPLFYEGKTPVLGEDVQVKQVGELSGGFPEAGAVSTAIPQMAAPPKPTFPPFPKFEFPPPPEFPELNFEYDPGELPTLPTKPEFGPSPERPEIPWWQQAINAGMGGAGLAKKVWDLGDQAMAPPPMPGWAPSGVSLAGAADAPWWSGTTPGSEFAQLNTGYGPAGAGSAGMPNQGFSLTGPELSTPEMLTTEGISVADPTGAAPTSIGPYLGAAAGALGLGLGAYNLATAQEPGQMVNAIPGLVAGGLGTAGSIGGMAGMSSMAGLAPFAGPIAALAIPALAGSLWNKYYTQPKDRARFPEGYQYIPGTGDENASRGALGVDPSTGRVLEYLGNGSYQWHESMKQGPMTPENFLKYEIEPTGALLSRPGYGTIPKTLMERDVSRAGQPIAPGMAPSVPTLAHMNAWRAEQAAPILAQIQTANPGLSPQQAWDLYNRTPEAEAARNQVTQWGNQRPTGGGESAGDIDWNAYGTGGTGPVPKPAPAAPPPTGGVTPAIIAQVYQQYLGRAPSSAEIEMHSTKWPSVAHFTSAVQAAAPKPAAPAPAPAPPTPAPAPAPPTPAAPKPAAPQAPPPPSQSLITQAYQKYYKRNPTAQEMQQQYNEAVSRKETPDMFWARLRQHFGY